MRSRTDELALLRAWRAGDRSAGDQLMRAYYRRVLGYFRPRAPEVAEDLTQRTFLACAEGRHRFEPTTFVGFLFGIARNQLYSHFEQRRRDPDIHFRSVPPPSVLTPSGVVRLRQEHSLLLRALETLSEDQQAVLGLFYVQGLKTDEIAEALQISVTSVTSRMSRARASLRERIAALPATPRAREALSTDLDRWFQSLVEVSDVGAGEPVLSKR